MTTTTWDRTEKELKLNHEWIYPSGCIPSQQVTELKESRVYSVRNYVAEHRLRPPDPLYEHQTARERVYSVDLRSGMSFVDQKSPCPHGGIHGLQTLRLYYEGVLPFTFINVPTITPWVFRLREEIADMKLNLGSQVAEYRETAKLFVKTAKALKMGFDIVRGKMPSRHKLRACSIPAAVLAYNYGIRPLVDDLFSATEILQLKLGMPLKRRISVLAKAEHLDTLDEPGSWKVEYLSTLSQRATVYLEFNPDWHNYVPITFGNPLEWAWELIPFSFVVDSVIPIGKWLGLLDAMKGVTVSYGSLTTKESCEYSGFWTQEGYHGVRAATGISNSYKRDVLYDSTMPPMTLPGYSPSKSWRTVVNHVALLATVSTACARNLITPPVKDSLFS